MSLGRDQRRSMGLFAALLLALTLAATSQVEAQSAQSNKGTILVSATLQSQLRLSLSDISLDIPVADPTQKSGIITVPVTSSWVLGSASNGVDMVGYFDSPAAALTDNAGHVIPADHINGGVSADEMAPFATTTSSGSGSRVFFRQAISRQNVSASRNDTVQIQVSRIDDLGAPAAEYRGVLHLRLISY